jgi:hypothetical protein
MKGLVAMPTSATSHHRYALGVTMVAARHLSVDITAHTSMARALRAAGPG